MSLTISPAQIVEESGSPLLAAPNAWPRWPLGEVATILNGYAFKSKEFVPDGGLPLIRIRDIFGDRTVVGYVGEYEDRYLVQPGELLVGMDGDFNCARWRGPKGLLNQRVCKITPDATQLDLDFLTHILPGYLQAIHDVTSSTTVTHLSSRDVAQIPIPVPLLAVQKELAELFGTSDSKQQSSSAHLRTARRAVERFRQAVLAAACSGRLTADWRETHMAAESSQELLKRSRRLVAASAGRRPHMEGWFEPEWLEIPESWRWAPLRELATIRGGIQKQPKRAPKKNAHPYLRVANVLRGRLDLSEIHQFELFNDELDRYRLEPGDLLVVEGNGSPAEIGRSALWNGEIPNCVHQNHIIRVRCALMIPRFVDLFWNSPIAAREIAALAVTSAGLYSLSANKIGSAPVAVVPLEEQREIVRRAEGLLVLADSLIARIIAVSVRVERSAQAVLTKALRGELVGKRT